MSFTSYEYLVFLTAVVALYWALRARRLQNALLLGVSYVFYGWVHPWFCILIASSTLVDYACALGMERAPSNKRRWLLVSLLVNLSMLGVFKYLGFFVESARDALAALGLPTSEVVLRIFLPVGISFYTFQTLSYTIDVYRGRLRARTSLLDFALFVASFPQLVAGPIERAERFLPQLEAPRRWSGARFASALPLLVGGYFKKLVVADNVAVPVDQIFMLHSPSPALLAAGSLGFAVQIWADFSAYTDIARGSARLLGLELSENFRAPYLAISPSDFWRRWHISFSSWIRDYLYIPLGGSRVRTPLQHLGVVAASMGLSGLWHGAAWNFVCWGLYHALLLFAWHRLGLGGRWTPATRTTALVAWAAMSLFTLFGWALFRAPSLAWLWSALTSAQPGLPAEPLAALYSLALVALYSTPLLLLVAARRAAERAPDLRAACLGLCLVATVLLARSGAQDFIYFRF